MCIDTLSGYDRYDIMLMKKTKTIVLNVASINMLFSLFANNTEPSNHSSTYCLIIILFIKCGEGILNQYSHNRPCISTMKLIPILLAISTVWNPVDATDLTHGVRGRQQKPIPRRLHEAKSTKVGSDHGVRGQEEEEGANNQEQPQQQEQSTRTLRSLIKWNFSFGGGGDDTNEAAVDSPSAGPISIATTLADAIAAAAAAVTTTPTVTPVTDGQQTNMENVVVATNEEDEDDIEEEEWIFEEYDCNSKDGAAMSMSTKTKRSSSTITSTSTSNLVRRVLRGTDGRYQRDYNEDGKIIAPTTTTTTTASSSSSGTGVAFVSVGDTIDEDESTNTGGAAKVSLYTCFYIYLIIIQ